MEADVDIAGDGIRLGPVTGLRCPMVAVQESYSSHLASQENAAVQAKGKTRNTVA